MRGRRGVPPYATPAELLDMEKHDPAGLMRRFKIALDHVHETGRLRPSDLQLPIYASSPYVKVSLQGYEGGEFDPEALGAAYIVVRPSDCRGTNTNGDYNLRQQVPNPPRLYSCPPFRPPAY